MYNISCHLILRTVQIGYCENEMLNMAKKRGKKKKEENVVRLSAIALSTRERTKQKRIAVLY